MHENTHQHTATRLICETQRGYKIDHGIFPEYEPVGLHFHDCYEILIHVRNGPYYHAGQQVLIPQPYEMFVFPPYQIHGMTVQNTLRDYERLYIHVSPQLLDLLGFDQVPVKQVLNQYCHSHGARLMLTQKEFGQLYTLATKISPETPDQTPYSRMIDLAHLSCMFSHICKALSRAQEADAQLAEQPRTLVHQVCCYVNCHFTQDITLDTLSEHFGVSKYHLSHKFSEAFGMSVYHYVLMCRITLAQKLIHKGQCFQEIAAECGFKDYSNFLRAFTKLTGISPSAWRRQHESQQTEAR